MLQNLPAEILQQVFSYLDYKDLISCSLVCRWVRDVSYQDVLWKHQCANHWLENECPEERSWRCHFQQWYRNWGRYIHCYTAIRQAWNKIEHFMEQQCPSIRNSLRDGVTDEFLDEMEELSEKKLLPDLRCSYRIHDGQEKTAFGLYGSIVLHNHYRSESLLDLQTATNCQVMFPDALAITGCYDTCVTQMMALNEKDGYKAGTIFYPSNEELLSTCAFVTARSFTEWLTCFADQLERNEFIVLDKQLYRFQIVPDCSETTGDITVTVRTCFMPELSSTNVPHFCHTYRITMTMDERASKSACCQLETRHWIVTDENGHEVRVDGPGVVGEFPMMQPGSTFSWISCTTFATTYGSMKGHFTMRNLETGERMEVVCPTFQMKCLPYIIAPNTRRNSLIFIH